MLIIYIREALVNLWTARLRTILTMLGIVVSVALFISLVAIGQAVKRQVVGQIQSLGADLVYIVSSKQYALSNFDATNLTPDDLKVAQSLSDTKAVAPVRYLAGKLSTNAKTISPNLIIATSDNYASVRGLKIAKGSFFEQTNSTTGNNIIVIGPATEKQLFGDQSAIGQIINFENHSYQVVGVLAEAKPGTELSVGGGFDNIAFLPITTYEQTLTNQNSLYSVIVVQAKSSDRLEQVKKDLYQKILASRGGNDNFNVIAQEDLLQTSATIINILSGLILAIISISLLVGGISIMNIMLVTVAERTREIGIRKSVGALPRQIMIQFLIESIIIASLGGLGGILVAFTLSFLSSHYLAIDSTISPLLIIISLLISSAIGLIFGIGPAIRASRMSPIDALSHE